MYGADVNRYPTKGKPIGQGHLASLTRTSQAADQYWDQWNAYPQQWKSFQFIECRVNLHQ